MVGSELGMCFPRDILYIKTGLISQGVAKEPGEYSNQYRRTTQNPVCFCTRMHTETCLGYQRTIPFAQKFSRLTCNDSGASSRNCQLRRKSISVLAPHHQQFQSRLSASHFAC